MTAPELVKLAHTLGVDADRLDFLAGAPAGDLRALRGQIAQALFNADRHHFAKVAALSKAVPSAVAAKLTQHALPPLLAARTAELLEPQRAADLVARLPDAYVADVAAAMDPGRSPEVIASIPAERVARIAAELARRGEWVVIGGFVSHVSRAGLAASIGRLSGGQLLRVSYVLDDPARLDEVAGLLRDAQLEQLLQAAAADQLWDELAALRASLSDAARARLEQRLEAAAPETAEAIRAALERAGR